MPLKKSPHYVLDELTPSVQVFNNLKVVGQSTMYATLPYKMDPTYRFADTLFEDYAPKNIARILKNKAGDYFRVIGTHANVRKSIAKLDLPPCKAYLDCPYVDVAHAYVYDMMLPHWKDSRFLTNEEVMSTIDMDKAAGCPWTQLGFKTKRDFFSDRACQQYMFSDSFMEKPFLWKVWPKTEWLHIDDIKEDKVRTFIIAPSPAVYFGKVIWGDQNEKAKMVAWSSYGFNPYHGGTHRMATKLNRNRIKIHYDVKGWDRVLPIMMEVYQLRNAFLPLDRRMLEKMIQFLTGNMMESYLVLPDGTVIIKLIGNNSGGWNTTVDNIIAHFFILSHVLHFHFDGSSDIVDECVANLFGDDDLMSIPAYDGFDCFSNIEKSFRHVFGLYGMTLSPFRITDDIIGCEFLGFKIGMWNGFYVPVYDQARLLASFCYDIETKGNVGSACSKAWTLTIMCAAGDEFVFDFMCVVLERYCVALKDETDSTVQAYVTLGVPTREECFAFFTGMESSRLDALFMPEAVGIKHDYDV